MTTSKEVICSEKNLKNKHCIKYCISCFISYNTNFWWNVHRWIVQSTYERKRYDRIV